MSKGLYKELKDKEVVLNNLGLDLPEDYEAKYLTTLILELKALRSLKAQIEGN